MKPALVLVALGLCGCRRGATGPAASPAPAVAPEQASPPAGTLRDGVFSDSGSSLRVPVPPGWEVEQGPDSGTLRVRMNHAPTGAVVEIWRFAGVADLRPRSRSGCAWSFEDVGPYRSTIPVADPVGVGTCMPQDPSQARVLAWIIARPPHTWQLELHVPSRGLLPAIDAGQRLLGEVRWSPSLDGREGPSGPL